MEWIEEVLDRRNQNSLLQIATITDSCSNLNEADFALTMEMDIPVDKSVRFSINSVQMWYWQQSSIEFDGSWPLA